MRKILIVTIDGALAGEDGLVKQVGDSEELLSYLPRDADIFDHGKNLLVPGLSMFMFTIRKWR